MSPDGPGTSIRALALYHVAERRVECREEALAPPAAGEVAIASRYSAVSPGTEGMIFTGAFPRDEVLDTGLESLRGTFSYPFKYGYALVGDVSAVGAGVDPALVARTVFAFHPHQSHVVAPLAACHVLPEGIAPEAALFLPQVETALNLVMDGAPLAGERVLVFGLGVVGLLTAAMLARFPLERLIAVEPLAWRRDQARQWGIPETTDPGNSADWLGFVEHLKGADLIVEASGNAAALDQAMEAAAFDGRIVVGSWYGATAPAPHLGGRFHRQRLRLISSQVSTLNPALTGRWDKRRRIDFAWRMLAELQPQRLISRRYPLAKCMEAFEAVQARAEGIMQVIFEY